MLGTRLGSLYTMKAADTFFFFFLRMAFSCQKSGPTRFPDCHSHAHDLPPDLTCSTNRANDSVCVN